MGFAIAQPILLGFAVLAVLLANYQPAASRFPQEPWPPTIMEAKEQRGSWLFLRCFAVLDGAKTANACEPVQHVVSMKDPHI
jgi:hypothetical protein